MIVLSSCRKSVAPEKCIYIYNTPKQSLISGKRVRCPAQLGRCHKHRSGPAPVDLIQLDQHDLQTLTFSDFLADLGSYEYGPGSSMSTPVSSSAGKVWTISEVTIDKSAKGSANWSN